MSLRQLDAWSGDFGDAYTERNPVDPAKRASAFKTMLAGLHPRKILEAGCNRGHNLAAIEKAIDEPCELVGIDPNRHALELAKMSWPQFRFIEGDVCVLPFADRSFDLAFTAGVLIHIPPERLATAMHELERVSSRHILCVEYFSEREEEIAYRGQSGMLWKRDFGGIYQKTFPSLKLLNSGYWGADDGFDRTHWWLFEKP